VPVPGTPKKSRGLLIVISSPSGGGKTTVIHKIREQRSEFDYSVSCTTREPRPDEIDGKDYFFLSETEFVERIGNGEFLEWEWVHGHRYGTLKQTVNQALESGRKLLFDLDVFGALSIKKAFPDSLLIFLNPPNLETLKNRLKSRAEDSPEEIKKRLNRATMELEIGEEFDRIIINDDLSETVNRTILTIDQWSEVNLNQP
jgi:guanylate kinase